MTSLRTRIGRFEAPVDYGELRPWLQRVRLLAAGIVTSACLVGIALDVSGIWFPAAMGLVVMAHSATRGRVDHRPIEPLVLDAIAIAFGLGGAEHAHTALVAAAAYLIAASVTFGGRTSLMASLSAFAGATLIRPLLPVPGPQRLPLAGESIVWLAVFVFLAAVALSLMAAATAVFHSKGEHRNALAAQRRAAEIKNQFVSMVTHELRTPLTNISGFSETLAEMWRDLDGADVDEFLRIIVAESDHLKNLVEDVLAIPRLEAGRLLLETADFQLRPAAFKIASLLFPEGGDRQASVAISGDVMVNADPNRVEQVLRNLLENARKYGGDQITIEAVSLAGDWQIIVSDNGPGLPLEDRERIFGAFEQVTGGDSRTDTGFGLGLAVARNLVEAMGGRIWYEPGFPIGARFCFTLPISTAVPASRQAAAEVA